MAATARELGFSLLPWQRQVLNVGLEQAGRRPAYRDVLCSVPRQSGKSQMAMALLIWRMLEAPDQLVLYAAQNRASARRKLLHSWWPRIRRSPLGPRFKLFRGFGAEMLQADNGSRLELLSATESSGHGETTHLVVVDEAWVHPDAAIEQAVRPTMATVRTAQLWAMSTAGTPRSAWWRSKLDGGRASAEHGITTGMCLLEWAASPEDDPTDEAVWKATMPALGRLVDVATVRQDLANMAVAEFKRAMLNLWSDEAAEGWQVIGRDLWEASRL